MTFRPHQKNGLSPTLYLPTLSSLGLISTLMGLAPLAFALEHETPASVVHSLEEEIRWLQEENYVTTATKTLEDIKKSGSSVTVITAEELRESGARNLLDALKRVPGLGIYQIAMGMSAVEVRGVKTDFGEKVLFLMNGHPINNNLVNGGAHSSYNNFIVDDIKRVEVVRGPGSALYGANAFVAVINIITYDADDIDGTRLTLGAGSYEAKKLNLQYGGERNDLELAFNANVYDTDGFQGEVESDGIGASGKSDYWNQRYELGLQASYGQFSLQTKYVQRQSGPYLGAINVLNDESEQEYIDYFIELGYQLPVSSQLTLTSKVYFDHFEFDNLWEIYPEGAVDPNPPGTSYPNGSMYRSPIKHDKTGAEVQLDYQLNDQHKLLAGISGEHQSQYDVEAWVGNDVTPLLNISSVANWNSSQNRDILAAYIQDIWDIEDNFRAIIGARYDRYSDFGSSVNPRASLSWEFIEDYSLTASYGSAFRAPTFGELYNTNNASIVGDPATQPEEIETYEIAMSGEISKRTDMKITLFHNNIRDIIAGIPTTTSANQYGNIGKLEVNGLEWEYSTRQSSGSIISFNYTYQDAENKLTHNRAADVPKQKFNASYNYRHNRYVNLFAGLNHRGSLSRTELDSRSDIGGVTTVDLAVSLKGEKDAWDVTASIYNFFNKTYYDPTKAGVMLSDYPKEGRSLWVEASIKL